MKRGSGGGSVYNAQLSFVLCLAMSSCYKSSRYDCYGGL